jgi:uncharacterized protein YidB (DUF937 family)
MRRLALGEQAMSQLDIMFHDFAGPGATAPYLERALRAVMGPSPDGLGVTELLAAMRRAGFGDIVQSWTVAGPRRPVTAAQLAAAIGEARVGRLARRARLTETELLAELAEHLPGVIGRLARQGGLETLPSGGRHVLLKTATTPAPREASLGPCPRPSQRQCLWKPLFFRKMGSSGARHAPAYNLG